MIEYVKTWLELKTDRRAVTVQHAWHRPEHRVHQRLQAALGDDADPTIQSGDQQSIATLAASRLAGIWLADTLPPGTSLDATVSTDILLSRTFPGILRLTDSWAAENVSPVDVLPNGTRSINPRPACSGPSLYLAIVSIPARSQRITRGAHRRDGAAPMTSRFTATSRVPASLSPASYPRSHAVRHRVHQCPAANFHHALISSRSETNRQPGP